MMFRLRSTQRTETHAQPIDVRAEKPRWHASRWAYLGAVLVGQLVVVGVAYTAAKDVVTDGKDSFEQSTDKAIQSAENFYDSRIGKVDEAVIRFDQAKKACMVITEYKPVMDALRALATTTTVLAEPQSETANTVDSTVTTTP